MTPLDPLVYWKLKATLLSLTIREQEIGAARQKAFTDLGMPPGNYVFDDNQTAVLRIEDMQEQAKLQAEQAQQPPPAPAATEPPPAPDPVPEPVPAAPLGPENF
jgi:hypothetical protein